jgi:hypothetical protein
VTEEQWLACTDPVAMLETLRGKGGHKRKIGDFIIACMVRSLAAYRESPAKQRVWEFFNQQLGSEDVYSAATHASQYAREVEDAASMTHAELLREYVGNPFRQVIFDPSWHTPALAELVTFIDRNGAFDLMPALGAALSDAGCRDPMVLEHCRSTQHVAGCWLVDVLLRGVTASRTSAGEQARRMRCRRLVAAMP